MLHKESTLSALGHQARTEVGVEVKALGDSTGRDGGGRGGEGPLEHPVLPVCHATASTGVGLKAGEAKEGISNEAVGPVAHTVCEGVPEGGKQHMGEGQHWLGEVRLPVRTSGWCSCL